MKNKLLAVVGLLLVLLATANAVAASNGVSIDNTSNTIAINTARGNKTVFVDDYGHKVQINETPDRIVSLAPSNTENLYALGLNNSIVAVTSYCPPEAEEKPKIGGYSTVNVEKVISMKPDLVVAAHGNGKQVVERLRKYVPVYAVNPHNLDDIMHNIRVLGEMTNTEENASQTIQMMKDKIQEVREEVQNRDQNVNVTVAHIISYGPFWASGNNTFIDNLIDIAGGKNVFNFDGFKSVSREGLLAKNPDVIIVNGGGGMINRSENIIYQEIMEMTHLKAVKNGNVYVINRNLASRPSYRQVYALEDIAGDIGDYIDHDGVNNTLEKVVSNYYDGFHWAVEKPEKSDVVSAVTKAVTKYFNTQDKAEKSEIVSDVTHMVDLYFSL